MKLALWAALVAGCGTATNAQQLTSTTPFSSVKPSDPVVKWHIPADSYTRLEIIGGDPTGATPVGYKKRPGFLRVAWAKRYAAATTLKVSAGRFVATVPLLTMEHESSSKKGETFLRANTRTAFEFPFFLAGGNAQGDVASFELQVTGSDGTESSAAVLALGTAEKLLKVVAPSSGVITKLTADRSRELAGAVDASLNQIFSSNVTERTAFDAHVRSGSEYTIRVSIPSDEGDWENKKKSEPQLVGEWKVRLAKARPSLFSAAEFANNAPDASVCSSTAATSPCAIALADGLARPYAILSFKLFDGVNDVGTIGGFLRQQSWWTSMLPTPVKRAPQGGVDVEVLSDTPAPVAITKNIKPDDPKIVAFCRQIRSAMVDIGLNSLDSRLVAHAVGQSTMVDPAIGRAMAGTSECTASLTKLTG